MLLQFISFENVAVTNGINFTQLQVTEYRKTKQQSIFLIVIDGGWEPWTMMRQFFGKEDKNNRISYSFGAQYSYLLLCEKMKMDGKDKLCFRLAVIFANGKSSKREF